MNLRKANFAIDKRPLFISNRKDQEKKLLSGGFGTVARKHMLRSGQILTGITTGNTKPEHDSK